MPRSGPCPASALINTGSGKCLDVTNQCSANGNQLQIWTCTGAANQQWTVPGGGTTPTNPPTTTPPSSGLNPASRPAATSISPSGSSSCRSARPARRPPFVVSAQGANGFQDADFFTDKTDGAMTFWAPEKGVTTPNSKYARSELREMNSNGSAPTGSSPAPTG